MDRDRLDERARGEQLLQEQRYPEAIDSFSAHLQRVPSDPEALLQLGICHLLNREEQRFLAIHEQAARVIATAPALPRGVPRLWTLYRSLVAKVTATALAVGASAGCDHSGAPSPEVSAEPTPSSTAAATTSAAATATAASAPTAAETPPTVVPTAHASSTAAASPTATSALAPTVKPTATTPVAPAHRYSGGVMPPTTKPSHRYSGGVF
jgi:hypothetical protein